MLQPPPLVESPAFGAGRRALLRALAPLALLIAGGTSTGRLLAEGTHTQVWPEADLYHRLDARWRLCGLPASTRGAEGDRLTLQAGLHLEYSMMPILHFQGGSKTDVERYRYLQFRVGYRLDRYDQGESRLEHRAIAEATLRGHLTEDILGLHRARGEFR